MKSQGIRISDGRNGVLNVILSDILDEITNGDSLYWSILFLDGIINPGQNVSINEYEDKINRSVDGLQIGWETLTKLSEKFFQMYEVILIGCKDKKLLKRYGEEKVMFKTCDISIYLIDCAFWEVYSKDQELLLRIKKKFNDTELLEV